MRIRQCYSGLKNFKSAFRQKYGLDSYWSRTEPAIFFGVYKSQWMRIREHTGFLVIVWAGTDIVQLMKDPEMIKHLKKRKDTYYIAISKFISDDMKKIGLDHTILPITPFESTIDPEIIGDAIYVYLPPDTGNIYNPKLVHELQERIEDIEFIISYSGRMSREDLIENIYPRCFTGLRLTEHDGQANTVMELGMMGRPVFWNGGTPQTYSWENVDQLEKEIRQLYQLRYEIDVERISTDVHNFLKLSNDWLHTWFYDPSTIPFPEKTEITGKKLPKATVIINTYRESIKLLSETIMGYEAQEGVDLQILVSTVSGDPSIPIAIHRGHDVAISPEPGIYSQLNNSLKYVTGDWVCYASGNDFPAPDKIASEIKMCKKKKKKVCYSAFYKTDSLLCVRSIAKFQPYDYQRHLSGNFVNDCSMISKKILDKYGPFDEQWGNHAFWDFWLRVYEGEGNVFTYNPVPTWYYRLTSESQHIKRSRSEEAKKINESLRIKMIESHTI